MAYSSAYKFLVKFSSVLKEKDPHFKFSIVFSELKTLLFKMSLRKWIKMTIKSTNKPFIIFAALYAFLLGIFILAGFFINSSKLIPQPHFFSMLNNGTVFDYLLIGFSLFSVVLVCFFAVVLYWQKNTQEKSSINEELLALDGCADIIWHWNITANTLSFSGTLLDQLGIQFDKKHYDFDEWLKLLHPEDKDNTLSAFKNHIVNNTPYNVEFRMKAKDESWYWFHSKGQARFNNSGKAMLMVGGMNDITHSKAIYFEREYLIKALEKSNSELDNFIYIASHDLKAPLRVIENISHWLEEDLGERLDNSSKENLSLLRNRIHRMENLLKDLLEYSRIGLKSKKSYDEIVSGDELIQDITLLSPMPDGFIMTVNKEFLSLKINKMPLQLILLKLIGNAIKHHDKDSGLIEVDVKEGNLQYSVSVKDDGPGIAPIYHKRIFEMLQTLKPRDKVEGSGMGLSIVRRHIELLGGTIGVESEIGHGSTFVFTWPKKPN
ncbi:MAG: signal transduction histidine kinase [Cognaticolwellia sp.]|jgi:signal transduction histidine kinase